MKQKFSELDTQIVKREIESILSNRVKEIRGDKFTITIVFSKTPYSIFASIKSNVYRLHLTKSYKENDLHPFHSHLKGLKLRGVKAPLRERIFYLLFEGRDRKGFPKRVILAIELTGKYSNAILIDSKGKIIDVHKRVDESKSRVRVLMPELKYEPPPQKQVSLWELEESKIGNFLKKHFPYTEREFGFFEPKDILSNLLSTIQKCTPVLYFDKNLSLLFYSPLDIKSLSDTPRAYFKSYSEALEMYFKEPEGHKKEKVLLTPLLAQLERLRDYEEDKKKGELILSHLHEIENGLSKIKIDGIEIEIKEGKSPIEVAQEFFKRYRKKKRGYFKLLKKIESLKKREIEKKHKEKKIEESPKPYYEFISPSGFKVLVGKSAKGNEIITFLIAKDSDLFFHAKDAPGTHVILIKGEREPAEEDIYFAAQLALKHSKLAPDGKGLVTVTEKKHVRRAKGTRGLVILKKEKVIHVRYEAENSN